MSWRLSAEILPSMNAFCAFTFPWTMPMSVSAATFTVQVAFAGAPSLVLQAPFSTSGDKNWG